MNTVLLNQMIVIISQSFNECFSNDEQAIIGAFLTTLGDMLSLNSAYISYLQDQNSLSKQNQNDYDLLEKSIEKIKGRCGQFLGPKGTRRRKTWHIRNKKKNELSPYMMN